VTTRIPAASDGPDYCYECERTSQQERNEDGFSTFQMVLQRDGVILFYYKEMTGTHR
jgi:hypothetical protein